MYLIVESPPLLLLLSSNSRYISFFVTFSLLLVSRRKPSFTYSFLLVRRDESPLPPQVLYVLSPTLDPGCYRRFEFVQARSSTSNTHLTRTPVDGWVKSMSLSSRLRSDEGFAVYVEVSKSKRVIRSKKKKNTKGVKLQRSGH